MKDLEDSTCSISDLVKAANRRDSDWEEMTLNIWKSKFTTSSLPYRAPDESHINMVNRVRNSYISHSPNDQDWITKWVSAYEMSRLLSGFEYHDLGLLYSTADSALIKAWILAFVISDSLRFGCDHSFTDFATFKILGSLIDIELPSKLDTPITGWTLEGTSEPTNFEDLFGQVADCALKSYKLVSPRAIIIELFMRILKNPGQHWDPPYSVGKKAGLTDEQMVLALHSDHAFERFNPEYIADILLAALPPKRISLRDSSPKRTKLSK